MTSTPTRTFSSDGSRLPTICFDFTPVATSITRKVCSKLGSTVAPQMIRAVGETFDCTTSATRSASEMVMSFPPVTLISTPCAVDTSTSRRGELMASSMASTARLSPTAWLSPRPIIATPPPFMIVFTSLKSRLTSPGFVMISVRPLIDRMSTSSANLNARFNDCRGTKSRSLSFGMVITVSAASRSRSRPHSALSIRSLPSPRNGNVTTAIVRAPISFASRATYPQLPVPVPPPRPQVTNTMSDPWTIAREAEEELRAIVQGSDIVFVTCGLGGGTGTGSCGYVARLAKEMGALTIAVVTLPFRGEGKLRMESAEWGLERLRDAADTVITIPNDKLLDLVPRQSLNLAFKFADEVLMRSIKGLTEIITKPGLVNLDFNDVKTIMKGGGVAMIGLGESQAVGDNRAVEAIEEAINSPLLEVDVSTAHGVLINVTGGNDMTISEAERVAEVVQSKVSPTARIIWGATVDPSLEHTLRVMLVATGVKSKQIVGRRDPSEERARIGLDVIR